MVAILEPLTQDFSISALSPSAILPERVTLRLPHEQKKLHLKGAFVAANLAHCQAQELKELNW